jgi:hypothetical protein
MFNRTNLTLSARSLSNRLNLGTRSLALVANVKNGGLALRIRHAHQDHDVLRDGMAWYDVFPIMPVGYVIPSIPGSFSTSQQSQSVGQSRPSGRVAESVRAMADLRPASLVGCPEPCVPVGVPGTPPESVVVSERGSCERERTFEARAARKVPAKPGLKRPARRAAKAAAIRAASTGK